MKKMMMMVSISLLITLTAYSQQPAYKASLDSLKSITDPSKQEQILTRLQKEHPTDNFDQQVVNLAYNFAMARNTKKATQYMKMVSGRARTALLGNIPTQIASYDAESAEALIDEELSKTDNSPQDRQYLLYAQSQVLAKKGEFAKAFTAMSEYYTQSQRKTPALTANYYFLMSKSGNQKDALPELEKAVLAGVADEQLKAELRSAYVKLNPSKDAKPYMENLIKQFEEKSKALVVTKMIDEQAPNFKVTDIKGKEVFLADFKGKVVVIDFWATWCGPCKKALPAMQMTVNKYKNDPKVKFLFIHTWESVADPKADAIKYFADNSFDLPLYMDVRDPQTKKNPAISMFNVQGIPAKFVIDPAGKIRFKTSGFGGTNEAAVNELSSMIDLSK